MERRLPIGEAKARFAECIRRAEQGETIVLTRHGRPAARLTGLAPRSTSPDAEGSESSPPAGDVREPGATYDAPPPPVPAPESRREALVRLLREEIWPRVPEDLLGKGIDKREREEILGYGGRGV